MNLPPASTALQHKTDKQSWTVRQDAVLIDTVLQHPENRPILPERLGRSTTAIRLRIRWLRQCNLLPAKPHA